MPPESDAPAQTQDWSDVSTGPAADQSDPPRPGLTGLPLRYEAQACIGTGGTSEVYRVWDRLLDRPLALKVLRVDRDGPQLRERFLLEARLTARLQHPGIVPVHDQGVLDDGRLWFAMREVQGYTLSALRTTSSHPAPSGGSAPEGWTLRRRIGVFEQAARIVAYAHAEGVAHLDLKPDNLIVGAFGEVQVLDWGLAVPVHPTRAGSPPTGPYAPVAGTPGYMAPEQARGDAARIGLASDLHALGATLLELLTGFPPYPHGAEGWRATVAGTPRPYSRADLPSPDAWPLLALALEAIRPDATARPDIQALVRSVNAWLEGDHRREEALATVAGTVALRAEIADLRAQARAAGEAGRQLLAEVAREAPETEKWAAWARLDEAQALEAEAEVREAEWVRGLHGALERVPELAEAHDPLADHWKEKVDDAETRGDTLAAARGGVWLAAHDRGRHHAWRLGDGTVSLSTLPPGATVTLSRYEEHHRRLEAVPAGTLGQTQVEDAPLPRGSWLLRLDAPGCMTVHLPVRIGRQEQWENLAPGDAAPRPIHLPRLGALTDDERLIPAGWFLTGGDAEAADPLPGRRLWVDAFVMRRFVVTWAEYLAFLDDLAARGDDQTLARALPRAPMSSAHAGEPLAHLHAGRHTLTFEDAALGEAAPDHPATLLDWFAARSYARWLAGRTGQPWRLPNEWEWEKAGRGVDGRSFPWGNTFDPSRACCSHSFRGPPHATSVTDHPADESPYGIRGLAGNVREWCLNGWTRTGPTEDRVTITDDADDAVSDRQDWRSVRGGAFTTNPQSCRLAGRLAARPHDRLSTLGFRMVRSVP